MQKRKVFLSVFAAVVAFLLAVPAQAKDWPDKPVKIIVPFAPGGNTDGIARMIAKRLGEASAQNFIVENRAGAGGVLAAEAVARAPADGYTLLVAPMSLLAVLPTMTRTPYDPARDFAPVSNIGSNPLVLITHPGVPATTVADFVEHVRTQPGKLSYVAAYGSLPHLAMALFLKRVGLEMIPVSYKGGAAPMTDIVAGHVQSYFAPLSDVLPHKTSGTLRLLAVSGDRRSAQLPGIPTLAESGFSDFKALTWNGLLAPAGVPREVVDWIAQEVSRAVKDQGFVERLGSFGIDPLGNSPGEFAAQIASDIAFWAEAIRIAGVQEK